MRGEWLHAIAETLKTIRRRIHHACGFSGPADNNFALAVAESRNPARKTSRKLLLRFAERQRRQQPKLYSVQISNGVDEIEKNLDGIDEVKSVPRTHILQTDLENLFAQLTGRVKTLEYVRSSKKLDKKIEMSGGVHTNDHLARLWANDEVARILAPHDASLTDDAITLAVNE